MIKSLALELARYCIRVNGLAPAYLEPEFCGDLWKSDSRKAMIGRIPQRRLGKLLDGPPLLRASDWSAHMTGSVIEVDGGRLVCTL